MIKKFNQQCVGSSLDDFLVSEGVEQEVTITAAIRILKWQVITLLEYKVLEQNLSNKNGPKGP